MPASNSAIHSVPLLSVLLGLEVVFVLAGMVLLFTRRRLILPHFRGLAPTPLTPSHYSANELALALGFAFGGALILQQIVAVIADRYFPRPVDGSLGLFHVLAGAGFQFGLLAGLGHAWFWHLRRNRRAAQLTPTPPHAALPLARILRGGFFTFLVSLFVVGPISIYWQTILEWLHIDAPQQDLIRLFGRPGAMTSLLILSFLAIVVAPVTEELFFRIGAFRWLRTRVPRPVALLVPALVFALVHGYVSVLGPLTVLAIILALAYEHYGHPAVPILAHGLFNLNSIALVLAGFSA